MIRELRKMCLANDRRKGEAKGEEKKNHAVVENLIVKLGLTDEQAAEIAEVDLAYVKKVREKSTC